MIALPGSSPADVGAVQGSAYGYFASISLFGTPFARGPEPIQTLPLGGSVVPITATAPSGLVQAGPATFFSSGPITVSTQGTTGPGGSVTSTATIDQVNTSGVELFTADNVSSTCTASETGVSGSTTITNGTHVTSEGEDPGFDDGDEVIVSIPTVPDPNTTYNGQVESVGDTFQAVFNEQIVSPDGSITVNAYHLYLLGPAAVGEVIVGQVTCDVTTGTTTSSSTTSTSTTSTSTTSTSTTSTTTTSTTRPPLPGSSLACATLDAVRRTFENVPFLRPFVARIDAVQAALGCP